MIILTKASGLNKRTCLFLQTQPVLKGQQDKPNRGDKGNRYEQLNVTKKVENNSDFSEKESLKDGKT